MRQAFFRRALLGKAGQVLVLLVVLSAIGQKGWGQSSPAPELREPEIAGRVIDADSRLPLVGATVSLAVIREKSPTWNFLRAVATDASGSYRFPRLDRGRYRISVSRIGYIGAVLEVDLTTSTASRLSVGLEVDPISLSSLTISGVRPETYGRMREPDPPATLESGFVDELRQQRFLVSDTRELTHTEVIAAVTLAETDIFRALQRVPGVGTRDDYTATMWTRGATWDQTRVFFDGLPLYNPTHAGWLFAAVSPDAIASATFHPGYRPARWGEGSAGVLDLRSRTGSPGEAFRGSAEISMASARMALDGSAANGRFNWMVAARRSYVDVLSAMVEGALGSDDLNVPYDFTDLTTRVDMKLGQTWTASASGFFEYDHLRGDIAGLLEGNRGRWGNRAGRVTLDGPLGPLRSSVSIGGTDFSTLIYQHDDLPDPGQLTLPRLENGIEHRLLSLELAPRSTSGLLGDWSLGAQLSRDSVRYDGPFSLIGALILGAPGDSLTHSPFSYGNSLSHGAVWGERRWSLGDRFAAVTGLRMEFGDSVANGGELRLAPRLAVRTELTDKVALTGGWSRNYQYTQDISPAAGPIGPQLHLSAIWVLASAARAFPAVRTDLSTIGIEAEMGSGWSAIANLYDRRSSGLKIPNPAPGLVTPSRAPDAEAAGNAIGAEATVRRLTDRWMGSLAYSWGESNLESVPIEAGVDPLHFPSSADIRHGLDAVGMMRFDGGLQLGGAFTFGSGVPFTRLLLGGDGSDANPRLAAPNAERTPTYASLDLMAEYEYRFDSWAMSAYLQLRNATNRNNAVTYSGSINCPVTAENSFAARYANECGSENGLLDRFEPGLSRIPLVGVRIAF